MAHAWKFRIGLAALGLALAGAPAAADPAAPEAGSPWRFHPAQVADPDGLARRLREGSDPLAAYLRAGCAPETRRLLDADPSSPPSAALLPALVDELNRALADPELYQPARFAGVELSADSRALLDREPAGGDLLQRNRRLLEDAFPGELEAAWRTASTLEACDLRDPPALAQGLRSDPDPVSHYLRQQLPAETRQLLERLPDGQPPSDALQAGLLAVLNEAILGEALYTPERFAGVELAPMTRALLRQDPRGETRALLHRLLLEDAYPGLLRPIAPAPIEVQADSLEFDQQRNLMVGAGRVLVRRGPETLRGDQAVINMRTYDVQAKGRVTFERDNDAWQGDSLQYNFKTHRGDFGAFEAYLEPFYVRAQSSQRLGPDRFELRNARLTPCEGDRPDAYFRARKVWITPGRHVRAQHVVLFVKGVPVMYSPFWNQNIGDRNFISLVPGYSSRMYAFLLTAFNYRLTRHLEAATHVDVRTRRGVGLGQDLMWSSSGNAKGLSTERYSAADDDIWTLGRTGYRRRQRDGDSDDTWAGDLTGYYLHDAWPDEGKTQEYPIDPERYRLRLYHTQTFDAHRYLMAQADVLSDPKVVEHFFRDEFKSFPEPDNYLLLGHRAEHFTASLFAQKRFNDFYTTVDRLPELTLDVQRQQLWDSPFYYQSKTVGAVLDKQWEAHASNAPAMTIGRFDTAHMLYYPTKQLGFLIVTPRAGWRGTAFSKTKEDITNVTVATVTGTNGLPVATTNRTAALRETGGAFRSVPELGIETSFKTFKVWETYPGDVINNLRHIAEPYADYTFRPEPNVSSNALYPFDEVDAVGQASDIRFGMRNKLQTQRFDRQPTRGHDVYDLVNADLWTTARLDPEAGANSFSNLAWDIRSRPFDWLELKHDGAFDPYASQLQTLNTRLTVRDRALWAYYIEHRFTEGSSSLLNNRLTLSPFVGWEFGVFGRYEFETATLEAWGLTFQRTRDCLTWKLGLEQQDDDDFTVWVQFWFTQFPKVRVDAGL